MTDLSRDLASAREEKPQWLSVVPIEPSTLLFFSFAPMDGVTGQPSKLRGRKEKEPKIWSIGFPSIHPIHPNG